MAIGGSKLGTKELGIVAAVAALTVGTAELIRYFFNREKTVEASGEESATNQETKVS